MTCLLDWDRPSAGRVHFGALAKAFASGGHTLVGVVPTEGASDLFSRTVPTARFSEGIFGQLARSAAHLRVLLRTLREERPDILYYRFRSCSPLVVASARRAAPRTRIVTELNNWPSGLLLMSGYGRPLAALARWGQLTSARHSDLVRALTEDHRAKLLEHGIRPDRVVVAGTGADLDLFRPMNRDEACRVSGLDPTFQYVGFIGYLSRWQGVDTLVQAAPEILRRHPDARLVVAGDGPQRENLARVAAALGLGDRILLTGHVPHERVPALINAFTVCIGPLVPETGGRLTRSPMKLREYAACGKLSVTIRIGGLLEFEEAGIARLVPPADAAALAQTVGDCLADPAGLARAGAAARSYAERHFGWGRSAAVLMEGMERICR